MPVVRTPADHGYKVVQYYQSHSSIQEFQKVWRQQFLDTMQPKYMGEYWQVDYNHMDYLWVRQPDEEGEMASSREQTG